MPDDYGKSVFKEIGTLSSQLPSYVRQCCRSLHDGTDVEVLESFRAASYHILKKYQNDYPFVRIHLETIERFPPADIQHIIRTTNTGKLDICLATSTSQGLPKRACLHCPKVGVWMKMLREAGTMNEKGERINYN